MRASRTQAGPVLLWLCMVSTILSRARRSTLPVNLPRGSPIIVRRMLCYVTDRSRHAAPREERITLPLSGSPRPQVPLSGLRTIASPWVCKHDAVLGCSIPIRPLTSVCAVILSRHGIATSPNRLVPRNKVRTPDRARSTGSYRMSLVYQSTKNSSSFFSKIFPQKARNHPMTYKTMLIFPNIR